MNKADVSVQKSDCATNAVKTNAPHPCSSASFLPSTRPPLVAGAHSLSNITKPFVQPRLKIGASNDKYEQEADRVADQVMGMSASQVQGQVKPNGGKQMVQTKSLASKITPVIQRQADPEEDIDKDEQEELDEGLLQTKTHSCQATEISPELATQIQSLRGDGQPLPKSARSFFEPRFGQDFSGVRVHSGARAAQLARSANARAFTIGRDVVFDAGQYAPNSLEGKKLLAHELTHVVQQSRGAKNIAGGSQHAVVQRDAATRAKVRTMDERGPILQAMIRYVKANNSGGKAEARAKLVELIEAIPANLQGDFANMLEKETDKDGLGKYFRANIDVDFRNELIAILRGTPVPAKTKSPKKTKTHKRPQQSQGPAAKTPANSPRSEQFYKTGFKANRAFSRKRVHEGQWNLPGWPYDATLKGLWSKADPWGKAATPKSTIPFVHEVIRIQQKVGWKGPVKHVGIVDLALAKKLKAAAAKKGGEGEQKDLPFCSDKSRKKTKLWSKQSVESARYKKRKRLLLGQFTVVIKGVPITFKLYAVGEIKAGWECEINAGWLDACLDPFEAALKATATAGTESEIGGRGSLGLELALEAEEAEAISSEGGLSLFFGGKQNSDLELKGKLQPTKKKGIYKGHLAGQLATTVHVGSSLDGQVILRIAGQRVWWKRWVLKDHGWPKDAVLTGEVDFILDTGQIPPIPKRWMWGGKVKPKLHLNKKQIDTGVASMIKAASIRAGEAAGPPPPESDIKYGPMETGGASWVRANPLSKNGPEGKPPKDGASPGKWNVVKHALKKSDSKLVYIRGHLLNHNISGSGEEKNLAPITRSYNTSMEARFEKKAKDAVLKPKRGEPGVIRFKTTVDYGTHPDRKGPLPPPGPDRDLYKAERILPLRYNMSFVRLNWDDKKKKWVPKGKKETFNDDHRLPDTKLLAVPSGPKVYAAGGAQKSTQIWCGDLGCTTRSFLLDAYTKAGSLYLEDDVKEAIEIEHNLLVKYRLPFLKQDDYHSNVKVMKEVARERVLRFSKRWSKKMMYSDYAR